MTRDKEDAAIILLWQRQHVPLLLRVFILCPENEMNPLDQEQFVEIYAAAYLQNSRIKKGIHQNNVITECFQMCRIVSLPSFKRRCAVFRVILIVF